MVYGLSEKEDVFFARKVSLIKKNAFPLGKTFFKKSLVFFLAQLLEGRGIVAGTVGDVGNKDRLRNQAVDTEVLPGGDQPVAAIAQHFILRDMTR